MLAASGKAHALPERAWALLSVRVLPGTSMAKTLGTLDAITSRAGARAFVAPRGQAHEAPSESRIEHEGYRAIQNALGDAFPEAGCAPFMFSAGTDSRHYDCVADAVYRFTPVMQSKAEGSLAHRPNERVSVENLKRCSLFYEKLLLGSC